MHRRCNIIFYKGAMGKFLNIVVVLAAVVYFSQKSPHIEPVAYKIDFPEKLDGRLAINERLDNVERLHENVIHWPEGFAMHEGQIYTGLGDGRIVRITGEKVTEIARTGSTCEGQYQEHICGRPLGMTISKAGVLYVADAYHGLFAVDLKTGAKKNLIPGNKVLDNQPLTFLNDLSLDAKEESLYISQSTTKWNISHVIVSLFEHESSGRLLKYDLKTSKITVLLKDLPFPNGVEVTHDGTAVLVAKGILNNILKYYISGAKKGKSEDLPAKLPGEPDNISRSNRGTYWVAIAAARDQTTPNILDHLSEMPLVRKIVLNAHRILIAPFVAILNLFPYQETKEIAFELKTLRIMIDVVPTHGCIVEIDEAGEILQSLQSPSGKISHISEVLEHEGYLYLGSWRNRFLGRMKLDKTILRKAQEKEKKAPQEQAKPQREQKKASQESKESVKAKQPKKA